MKLLTTKTHHSKPLPYGRQTIGERDLLSVEECLKSSYLTTGPKVKEFEDKFAAYVGAKYAVAVSSGTAALHLACLAAGLEKDKELITSPMTFAASANCAFYCGAKPVFVDINEQGLIDENKIEKAITSKTKVLVPVHYTGLPCSMEKISEIAKKHHLVIIEDACHALGARYKNSKIGNCQYSDMACFSFHPVKHITTGEGGMITTNSKKLYQRLILLRNHGITRDKELLTNHSEGPWFYEMQELGFNYRLTDFQCALGLSQLEKVGHFIKKRRELAQRYDRELGNLTGIYGLNEKKGQFNSYHLYVLKVSNPQERKRLFNYLKNNQIFCQVHYIPVYWHPFYQKKGYSQGICPQAERFYGQIISLPLYPSLREEEQMEVIGKIKEYFQNKSMQDERRAKGQER